MGEFEFSFFMFISMSKCPTPLQEIDNNQVILPQIKEEILFCLCH